METNYTTFYSEKFEKNLGECPGIINLNIGDMFISANGEHYIITFKRFNMEKMIMIYHGKINK